MTRILVVGGGPGGCAAAISLHRTGNDVVLLERSRTPVDRVGETLAGEGVEILRELGVLAAFERLEARPSHLHRIHWGARQLERSALFVKTGPSRHLDRAAFDSMLLAAARDAGARVEHGSLLTIEPGGDALVANIRSGAQNARLTCEAVIDATGRVASVSRRLGARRERADRLVALTATFERGKLEPSSLVEGVAEGWWYTAPRPNGGLIAMYVTEDAAGKGERTEVWRRGLRAVVATRERLSALTRRTPITLCSAAPGFTHFDASLPALPVGDAAVSFDPISGRGLCFALRSGIEAARALRSAPLRSAFYAGALQIYREHLQQREQGYARQRAVLGSAFWQRRRDSAIDYGDQALPRREAHARH